MPEDRISVFVCEDAKLAERIVALYFGSGITYAGEFKKESRSKIISALQEIE